jgi:hypothetical protein
MSSKIILLIRVLERHLVVDPVLVKQRFVVLSELACGAEVVVGRAQVECVVELLRSDGFRDLELLFPHLLWEGGLEDSTAFFLVFISRPLKRQGLFPVPTVVGVAFAPEKVQFGPGSAPDTDIARAEFLVREPVSFLELRPVHLLS